MKILPTIITLLFSQIFFTIYGQNLVESFNPSGKQQIIYLPPIYLCAPNEFDSLGLKTGIWAYKANGFQLATYSGGEKNGIVINISGTIGTYNTRKFLSSVCTYRNDSLISYMDCPGASSPFAAAICTISSNTDFRKEAEAIGSLELDSLMQITGFAFENNNSYRISASGTRLFYKGESWETSSIPVGPQIRYNIDGTQNIIIPDIEYRELIACNKNTDTNSSQQQDTIYFKCPDITIFDQFPLIFHGPNQRDSIGQKIGQWAEVMKDNSLEISFYDKGKRFGYCQTYIPYHQGISRLAILAEIKDDHINGNALVFNQENGMPYIIANRTSPNRDFLKEADLLIGNGNSAETLQSYIYIYENNKLKREGWIICLESDFLKRRCFFVDKVTEYDDNGKSSLKQAPMDGKPIDEINLSRIADCSFAK